MNPQPPPIADPHSTHALPIEKEARFARAIALALVTVGSLLVAVGALFVLGLISNVLLVSPNKPGGPSLRDVPLILFMAAIPYGLGFPLISLGVRRWRSR